MRSLKKPPKREKQVGEEQTLYVWKPVLASFYQILSLPFLALLVGTLILLIIPSPATALLFVLLTLFGAGFFLIVRAYCRGHTFFLTDWRVRSTFKFLATRSSEAPLRTVANVEVYQDLPGRVLNFGSVYITTMSGVPVVFRGIPHPYEARQLILHAISSAEKPKK